MLKILTNNLFIKKDKIVYKVTKHTCSVITVHKELQY